MNFKEYYIKQAGGGLPYFQGSPYQRGYGLGGIFRNIFKWIMPIVKEHAIPVAKNVGKELLRTATNIAKDTLDGEDMGVSAKRRFKETINNISSQIHQGDGLVLKPGLGINRRKKSTKKQNRKKKRKLDIFDKK